MFQLDTKTGKPQRTTPDAACFEEHLYAQSTADGPDNTIEAFFSIVENHAAPALRRLVEDPLHQTPEDRETLSYFLAFQFSRTPVALSQIEGMSQVMTEAMFGVHFADPVSFRNVYREAIEEEATDDEIERMREYMQERLQSGAVPFDDPRTQAIEVMLSTADAVAETVHQLSWLVLEAEEGEFVTSDRAMSMHDPTLRFPWSGHAWRSSSEAQTCVPLDPTHCLMLEIGPARCGHAIVGPRTVRDVNLRTYGWADRFIYGRTQELMQEVRQAAKRHRDKVIRPRVPMQVMFEPADPNDPTVGAEHVKRGLPRGAWVPDEHGRRQFVAYTVLDPSKPRGTYGEYGAALGRRVIERAISDGLAAPDRLEPPSKQG